MIHARINKDTLIVASVEVASPDWVEEWTAQNPESAYFYAVADYNFHRFVNNDPRGIFTIARFFSIST